MKLEELVKQLQLAYGSGLRSVVLFGSAVAGEHNPKKSDYNVVVVVDALPLEKLRAVAAVSKAWAEAGNPPPLTFTSSEWRSSADIFPMEYADMLERHRVLFGNSPVRWDQSRRRLICGWRSSSRRWGSCSSCVRQQWGRVAIRGCSWRFWRRA